MTKEKSYTHVMRQLMFFPPEKLRIPITIVGCGAIGSYAAMALVTAGFENFTLYDDDSVEEENMSSTCYDHGQIGHAKVDALAALMRRKAAQKLTIVAARCRWGEADELPEGFLLLGPDTMVPRQLAHRKLKAALYGRGCDTKLFADARMSAEMLRVFTVRPGVEADIQGYENTLFDDKDGAVAPCSGKSTTYTAMIAGASLAQAVMDYVRQDVKVRCSQLLFDIRTRGIDRALEME